MITNCKASAAISQFGVIAAVVPIVFGATAETECPEITGSAAVVPIVVEATAELTQPEITGVATSIVDIKLADYLRVDKDVLWVTPEIWEQLMIMSNVEWTIV